MPRSQAQAVGKQEEDPLKKQLQSLEEDWNSYKKSIPRHCRIRSTAALTSNYNDHNNDIFSLGLLDNSPKKLLSSLQQCKPFTLTEKQAPVRSAKIEGRSLLEALESVKDDASPIYSVCSSVLIQEVEGSDGVINSSCSCCSKGSCSTSEAFDSSSSLASSSREVEEERRSGEERWLMRMIWLFVVLWVLIFGIILATEGFGGGEKYGEYITPT